MMNLLFVLLAKYLYLVVVLVTGLYIFISNTELQKRLIRLSIISLPLSFLILKIAGYLYYDPRPFVVKHIQPLIAHSADNGFPSDHTTLCATLATIIFFFNRKLGLFLYFLTLLVGIARVMVEVHHPIDILGALMIGSLSVYLSQILGKKIGFKFR